MDLSAPQVIAALIVSAFSLLGTVAVAIRQRKHEKEQGAAQREHEARLADLEGARSRELRRFDDLHKRRVEAAIELYGLIYEVERTSRFISLPSLGDKLPEGFGTWDERRNRAARAQAALDDRVYKVALLFSDDVNGALHEFNSAAFKMIVTAALAHGSLARGEPAPNADKEAQEGIEEMVQHRKAVLGHFQRILGAST